MSDTSDLSDVASQTEELFLKAAISAKKTTLPTTGVCYYCRDPSSTPFCDKLCLEDYERMKNLKKPIA